jgi:hypothetical protein
MGALVSPIVAAAGRGRNKRHDADSHLPLLPDLKDNRLHLRKPGYRDKTGSISGPRFRATTNFTI